MKRISPRPSKKIRHNYIRPLAAVGIEVTWKDVFLSFLFTFLFSFFFFVYLFCFY